MFEVKAVANGYYGGKVRVPGETFGIDKPDHFSVEWMTSDDAKVLSFVRDQTRLKGKVERDMTPDEKRREAAKDERAARHKEWLEGHGHEVDTVETRRVNTGGTDGVVGADVPKSGQKLSAPERIAAAKALTGRDDITTAKEADALLAAANVAGGSDNDDRSRDFASDPANNADAPATADADI